LDGKDAYEQIRVEPVDVWKTLFATPDGTMVSLVMQIGDCNAPATYQSLMNHIFSDYIGVFMDVYLDDIVIYSDTSGEHVMHVRKVIDRLRENKFFLSAHKLQFFKEELQILGHVIDAEGIRMDPAKVDTIVNWKTPTNKGLALSFIGAVGYLADGCLGVRIPMQPIQRVAAPTTVWRWTPTEARAFAEVKDIVHKWRNSHRRSIDYSPSAPMCNLCCDACLTGGSGVVSQGEDYLKADVIAFWSGKFNSAQQNYPVHELELLAIVESLRRFAHLLQGLKFRIYTDHKGLEWITSQKKLSPRQARWLEVLADFEFEIIHVPGKMNQLADALSRMYSDEPKGIVRAASEYVSADEGNAPKELILNMVSAPLYTGESIFLGAATRKWKARQAFPNAKKVVLKLSGPSGQLEGESIQTTENPVNFEDQPDHDGADDRPAIPVSALDDGSNELAPVPKSRPVLVHGQVAGHGRLDPLNQKGSTVAEELLAEEPISLTEVLNSGDPTLDIHGRILGRYVEDPFFDLILRNPRDYKNFEVSNGLVFLRDKERRLLCIPDVMVGPRRLREILISHAHSILAHLGPRKTITYLRDNVWWKGLNSDVDAFCESCSVCKMSKPSNHAPYGLLETLEVPTRPWETIGIDFVGPLPESKTLYGNFDMIMVAICHLTSLVHLMPTKQTYRARDVAEVIFDQVYKHHGMPKNIVSDRDMLFTSTFWRRLHELTRTELRMSSAYHPQSDGATERANRTMTQMVRQCVSSNQKDWASKLPAIEFAMNSACSQTTGYPPFVLNYGRMPPSMIWNNNSDYPGVRKFAQNMKDAILTAHDAILTARVKQTRLANQRRKEAPFVVGDMVYLSTVNLTLPKGRARKLAPKFVGPYRILEEFKNNSFRLDLPAELKQRGVHPSFHASLLRIHVPNDDRRFPGRQMSQIVALGNADEWAVSSIESHHGKGDDALFELIWKTGDRAWLPYHEISHLEVLNQYLESQGVSKIGELPRRISKDENIPVVSISPANDMALRNLVTDIIGDVGKYRTKNIGAASRSDKLRGDAYKSECGYRDHRFVPCGAMLNTAEQLDKFKDFAGILTSGEYDAGKHPTPLGYLEYAVLVQQDAEICVPFPPGVNLNTVMVDGREIHTLHATAARTPDDEAVEARKEPVYGVRRDHTGQPRGSNRHEGKHRGAFRRRGRGAVEEHRATRALINAFEAETELSMRKRTFPRCYASNESTTERERLRESRALSNRDNTRKYKGQGKVSDLPRDEQRFGNRTLDNRLVSQAPRSGSAISRSQANASAGPSGLTNAERSSVTVPLAVSPTNVPLPASPPPAGHMDVDGSSSARNGDGIRLPLLFVLIVANLIILVVQVLRSSEK